MTVIFTVSLKLENFHAISSNKMNSFKKDKGIIPSIFAFPPNCERQ